MKNKNSDPRIRYTKSSLEQALIKLLFDKPLKEITVCELCNKAQITRGTFYNHFHGVNDVYDSIENEFLNSLYFRLDKVKAYDVDNAFFRELVLLLYNNKDFLKILLTGTGNSSVIHNLLTYANKKFIKEFEEFYPGVNKNFIKTIFTFNINGALGLLLDWAKEGMKKPPEKIADEISFFHNIILKKAFNLKDQQT